MSDLMSFKKNMEFLGMPLPSDPSVVGLQPGRQRSVMLAEGDSLIIRGSAVSNTGTVNSQAGLQSYSLAAAVTVTIGPFRGRQKVAINGATGTVDLIVVDSAMTSAAVSATTNAVTVREPISGRARKLRSVKIRPKFAILGDSISEYNNQVTSLLINKMSRGWLTWALYLSYQQFSFEPGGNFGKAGDTTTQMLARLPATIAYGADYVNIMGDTNDVDLLVSSDLVTIPNLTTMYDAVLNSGAILVIFLTMNRSLNMTAAKQSLLAKNNEFKRQYAATHDNVLLVDNTKSWTDATTGLPLASNSADGLHPIPPGARTMAIDWLSVVQPTLPVLIRRATNIFDVYDATTNPGGNMLLNGVLAGSGVIAGTGPTVGCSGTIQPNFAPSRISGTSTAAFTAQARSDGEVGNELKIVVNSSSATASEVWRVTQVINAGATTFAPGDNLYVACEFEMSGMTGAWNEVALRPIQSDGVTGVTIQDMATPGQAMPNVNSKGQFMVPVFLIPAYAGSGVQRVEFRLQFGGDASLASPALAATFYLRFSEVRKVLP